MYFLPGRNFYRVAILLKKYNYMDIFKDRSIICKQFILVSHLTMAFFILLLVASHHKREREMRGGGI